MAKSGKGVKDGGKGHHRRPGEGYEDNYDRIFKQENTMKDPDDEDTRDIEEFLEEELGIPAELDFSDSVDMSDESIVVCPCCHENEVSTEQVADQMEGEQCSMCNFHTWEDNS